MRPRNFAGRTSLGAVVNAWGKGVRSERLESLSALGHATVSATVSTCWPCRTEV